MKRTLKQRIRDQRRRSGRQRLRKLADFLETEVKRGWFDLGTFATHGFTKKECGSTACALGWTPSAFPRSGTKLARVAGVFIFKFRSLTGFTAGAKFYDIGLGDSLDLFSPSFYPQGKTGKAAVVRKIRAFLKEGN